MNDSRWECRLPAIAADSAIWRHGLYRAWDPTCRANALMTEVSSAMKDEAAAAVEEATGDVGEFRKKPEDRVAVRPRYVMDTSALRRIRLLLEDFPKNHNLVLVAQPALLHLLSLTVNEDIHSRVTYSVQLHKLAPDDMQAFILGQLDRVVLPHSTFTDEALALIVRSSEGILRRARNLCISALLEAVRDRTRTVDLKQVNRVLMQPHWRKEQDLP